ncbi:MAG: nucleotide exchange factor GrpE [Acholeplasmatales bacterium]|nr:nucleotide exchange factor GrpE [Acholeplasmatales bacterium]
MEENKIEKEEAVAEEKEEQVEEKAEEAETIDEVDATDEPAAKETKKKEKKKDGKNKLEKENESLKEELAKLKNEYLKVFAEMENTKKRLKSESVNDRKYASQKVVSELVGPIDMLIQIVNMPAPSPEIQNYVIGFQMIANQLVDILKNEGLGNIEAAAGKDFDPKTMQAVSTEYDEAKPENTIIRVMQTGYMYKDRVLRPAMVVVNKKPVEEAPKDEKEGN